MDLVARHYGFHPNHAGYICCPFHREKTPSLKIYPDKGGWHCFGCGRGGTVIDFVMQLYNITFPQAVIRLSSDFGLDVTPRRRTKKERSEILERRRQEQEDREKEREEYMRVAEEHRYWHEVSVVFAPDKSHPDYFHPLYCEAVKRLPALEWWLDEHLFRR